MNKRLLIKICTLTLLFTSSIWNPAYSQEEKILTDQQAVIQTIKVLFDGMRAGDSTMLRSVLHPEAHLQSSFTNKEGISMLKGGSVDGWVTSVGTSHEEIYDEKIWSYKVRIDDNLASAWTEYTFYVGDKMSHCGVNAFHLVNTKEGWKISHITDTRRKQNCITEMPDIQKDIHEFMDNWHKAAARADEDTFFGSMTADGIYIGTDASERWTRDEMQKLLGVHFEKDSAWDFTKIDREIYLSEDKNIAWFEESLDTWMGVCRSSGVLTLTKEGWKLNHYHLSVAVPNDNVDAYLKIATPSSKLKKQ